MTNILLVSLGAFDIKHKYDFDKKIKYNRITRRPPLGLQYLCSTIEKNGSNCEIIDQTVSQISLGKLIKNIREKDYAFVGFYSYTLAPLKDKLVQYIKIIKKECSVKIIVGGPGSIHVKEFIDAGCDIVCHGEGEKTILKIIEYLKGKISIAEIKGISYKKDGIIVNNELQALIDNLDEIDFPNRDKISLNNYFDYFIFPMRKPYATMIASRGCPYKCTYCACPSIWRGKYRLRSVKNVMEEIDYLVQRYKVRYITFEDDIFGLNQRWLKEFCIELTGRKYDLNWMCILHPLSLRENKEEFITLLKNAGCNFFSFGLQSSNLDILKKINRDPETPFLLKETISIARKKGILTLVDFIFGLPGETKQTILENIKYISETHPHLINIHPLGLLFGTELEKMYKKTKVCNMPQEEIIFWCKKATRKFYLSVNNLIGIFIYILKNNPRWFFMAPRFFNAIIDVIELKNK